MEYSTNPHPQAQCKVFQVYPYLVTFLTLTVHAVLTGHFSLYRRVSNRRIFVFMVASSCGVGIVVLALQEIMVQDYNNG